MVKKIITVLISSLLSLSVIESAFAWDDTNTHRSLTLEVLKRGAIENNLINSLSLKHGSNTLLNGSAKRWLDDENTWLNGQSYSRIPTISAVIVAGSSDEDKPNCRSSNHFNDPLEPWDDAGLSDALGFILIGPYCLFDDYPISEIRSALTWGTGYTEPAEEPQDTTAMARNDWDWSSAREDFLVYLTGIDFDDRLVAFGDVDTLNLHLAMALRSLGQTMHLLQDMAVPAHARNDFFIGHTNVGTDPDKPRYWPFWAGSPLEHYVSGKRPFPANWINAIPRIDLGAAHPTVFWDADRYDGSNPDTPSEALGLAEYTNLNFFSESSAFAEQRLFNKIPYPRAESTNLPALIANDSLPREVTSEDGRKDKVLEIVKAYHGAYRGLLCKVGYMSIEARNHLDLNREEDRQVLSRTFQFDEMVYEAYAKHLIPLSIGYSTALLDYFFRGSFKIETGLPFIVEDRIAQVWVKLRNDTRTGEGMSDGSYMMALRYRPSDDAAEDGTEDRFAPADYIFRPDRPEDLPNNAEKEMSFSFNDPVHVSRYGSVLVSQGWWGKLGNESRAVAGRVFPLGKLHFNEEWNNGLEGNNPWFSYCDNPDNGETVVEVADSRLTIENIRWPDEEGLRCIDIARVFDDGGGSQGYPITADTFLHIKIDEMAINQQPPADPGYTTAWQGLFLRFDDEGTTPRYLLLTQPGQGVDSGPLIGIVGWLTFDLGLHCIANIHDMFRMCGLPIPDPLHLKSISFSQQLWQPSEATPVEHRQRMVADALRLIENVNEPDAAGAARMTMASGMDADGGSLPAFPGLGRIRAADPGSALDAAP